MKKITATISVLVVMVTIIVMACNVSVKSETETTEKETLTSETLIKRGEYLVNAIVCDDCHTPKKMGPNGPEFDFDRRFMGHPSNEAIPKIDTTAAKDWILFGQGLTAAVGPWGVSYAANLTSDTTGIGMWSEEQFLNVFRKGLSKGLEGNRSLLPPMPWFVYRNLTEDDLRAIFAYLKTSKPIKNVVPQPKPWKELNQAPIAQLK